METELIAHDAPGAIERAVALLSAGETVGLPTETVYGLAGDAGNAQAAAAIFHAKGRPFFDPLIVHLPDSAWVDRVTQPRPETRALLERLAARFWPGPLTLLLPRREGSVPDLVTAGSDQVAVRISAHPVFQRVIARFGRPLAAPSANRFGRISPTRAQDVREELGGRIPLILDGGPTEHGLESTIVELTPGGGLLIRRPGPITREMLAEFGPTSEAAPAGGAVVTPGALPGHYAPRTPLALLLPGASFPARAKIGLLGFRRDRPPAGVPAPTQIEWLSGDGDLREAAVRLFAALRRLDAAGLTLIAAELAPEGGLGLAINDRLRRAAAGAGTATPPGKND